MQSVIELVLALSVHDKGTRGHSERVRVFADLIADELKIDEPSQARLRWAALLHDVGKLEVPKTLLNKPGAPDEEEWKVLHRHPEEGARLVAPLRSPGSATGGGRLWSTTSVTTAPATHTQLKAHEISLAARIVAVADTYGVMTAPRPYKRSISVEAARQELTKVAGTQLDPAIVRAFLNISVGRLWRTIGFGAWIGQIPALGRLWGELGNIGSSGGGVDRRPSNCHRSQRCGRPDTLTEPHRIVDLRGINNSEHDGDRTSFGRGERHSHSINNARVVEPNPGAVWLGHTDGPGWGRRLRWCVADSDHAADVDSSADAYGNSPHRRPHQVRDQIPGVAILPHTSPSCTSYCNNNNLSLFTTYCEGNNDSVCTSHCLAITIIPASPTPAGPNNPHCQALPPECAKGAHGTFPSGMRFLAASRSARSSARWRSPERWLSERVP